MNWLQNLIQPQQQGGNMLQQSVSPKSGFMQQFNNFRTGDRGQFIGDMMAGWAMGQTPQQSLGMGAVTAREGAQERRGQQQEMAQRNQTVDWLKSQGLSDAQASMVAQNPQTLQEFLTKSVMPEEPQTTDDIREYNFAVQQGFDGSFNDYMTSQRRAGATTVNNNIPGAPTIGTIPQGYAASQDPVTGEWSMQPIAGGPAAAEIEKGQEAKDAATEAAMTASNTITTAAARAREAAANQNFGPAGTTAVANIPVIGAMTDSAEVVRQVDVLKSQAAFENLNAMRQQSPTGGALGSVTEKELKMLQDKSGALDPNSPTFTRDLADYEQTLLRIIHGKEAGDAIFQATRPKGDGEDDIDALVDRYAN